MVSPDPNDVSALAMLVQRVVSESGGPEGFDALTWTNSWICRANPALGGACPADYMMTAKGREIVEMLVRRMQSGAYS